MAKNYDKCYVYRYIDTKDKVIKYVGIVVEGTLPNRHKQHMREDWYKEGDFICECVEVNNKSEAEAIESHLISLYRTDKYYNKAKTGWGVNKYLPTKYNWEIATLEETIDDIINSMQIYSEWVLDGKKYDTKEIGSVINNFAKRIMMAQERQSKIDEWNTL